MAQVFVGRTRSDWTLNHERNPLAAAVTGESTPEKFSNMEPPHALDVLNKAVSHENAPRTYRYYGISGCSRDRRSPFPVERKHVFRLVEARYPVKNFWLGPGHASQSLRDACDPILGHSTGCFALARLVRTVLQVLCHSRLLSLQLTRTLRYANVVCH